MIEISKLLLRPKNSADTEFLIALYETSRDEEFQFVAWKDDDERRVFFQQQFNAQELHFNSNYENLDYDVITYNSKNIGRLILHKTLDKIHCVDIIIIPEFRKQGISKIVMNSIVQELDFKKIEATLYFEKSKPYLEHIYSKYGFVTEEDLGTHKFMRRIIKAE